MKPMCGPALGLVIALRALLRGADVGEHQLDRSLAAARASSVSPIALISSGRVLRARCPGRSARRSRSIDSSISGKNVLGSREAAQPLASTRTTDAATTVHRKGSTRRRAPRRSASAMPSMNASTALAEPAVLGVAEEVAAGHRRHRTC